MRKIVLNVNEITYIYGVIEEIKASLTPLGFNELFEQHMQQFDHLPKTKIYELTEQVHEIKFGGRRYSSFDSFRKTRSNFIKSFVK